MKDQLTERKSLVNGVNSLNTCVWHANFYISVLVYAWPHPKLALTQTFSATLHLYRSYPSSPLRVMKPSRVQIVIHLAYGEWVNCCPLKGWRTTEEGRMQDKKRNKKLNKSYETAPHVLAITGIAGINLSCRENSDYIFFTGSSQNVGTICHACTQHIQKALQGIVVYVCCMIYSICSCI